MIRFYDNILMFLYLNYEMLICCLKNVEYVFKRVFVLEYKFYMYVWFYNGFIGS